ncbi:probable RNA methyltransferase At5g51130 [Coffea arabica]|uniref:RNA methyltransferase n=1 Tax=Coffea arabica TaxID=13443 RepID=A0ABM4UNE1_COFAR|nr:probable RNA methyltransferase At5g51130 [Coffea arabica]
MGEPLDDKEEEKQKEHEQQQQQSPANCSNSDSKKKRKRKEVAIFGNYRHYYGYRISQDLDEDPRLKVMKKEWFEGKDCLDIGCNSGIITITIAKKFSCRSILGVDIDRARIDDAHWSLKKIMKRSFNMQGEKVNQSKKSATELQSELQRDFSGNSGGDLSDIVSFQKGNFVQSWHPPENTYYHAILCLSVTKWIHLNWGDDGLLALFSKVWMLLQPGGVFILEPQPWISYSKNRLVSQTASDNYQNMKIGPEDFQDILLDKIGFRSVENITSSLPDSKSGFNRPILAFWK